MTTRKRVGNGIRSVTTGITGIEEFRNKYNEKNSDEDKLELLFDYYKQLKREGNTQQKKRFAEIIRGVNTEDSNKEITGYIKDPENTSYTLEIGYNQLATFLMDQKVRNEEEENRVMREMRKEIIEIQQKKKQIDDNDKPQDIINVPFIIPTTILHQNDPTILNPVTPPQSPLPQLVFDNDLDFEQKYDEEEEKHTIFTSQEKQSNIRDTIIAEANNIWSIEQLDQIIQDLNNIKLKRNPIKSEALIRPSTISLTPSSSSSPPSILPLQTFLLLLDF